MSKLGRSLCALVAVSLASAAPAAAQSDTGWTYVVAPYLWMSGMTGQVGFRDRVADVDVPFSTLLSDLKFAAMASGEARYKHSVESLDVIWTSLHSTDHFRIDSAGPGSSLDLKQRMLILQPALGYSIIDTPMGAVDVFAALRYYYVGADLTAAFGNRPANTRSGSSNWADPVVALRLRGQLTAKWRAMLSIDVGGTGSDSWSWQTNDGVGYAFAKAWTAFASYRYLSVDRHPNDFRFDMNLSGPVLGVTYRF